MGENNNLSVGQQNVDRHDKQLKTDWAKLSSADKTIRLRLCAVAYAITGQWVKSYKLVKISRFDQDAIRKSQDYKNAERWVEGNPRITNLYSDLILHEKGYQVFASSVDIYQEFGLNELRDEWLTWKHGTVESMEAEVKYREVTELEKSQMKSNAEKLTAIAEEMMPELAPNEEKPERPKLKTVMFGGENWTYEKWMEETTLMYQTAKREQDTAVMIKMLDLISKANGYIGGNSDFESEYAARLDAEAQRIMLQQGLIEGCDSDYTLEDE